MEAAGPAGRKIGPGRVISETFDIYKSQFGVLVLMALVVFVVAGILQGLASEIEGLFGSLLGTAVNLIAIALYTGFVVKLVEDVRSGQRDFSAGELISAATPAIGSLILNGILRGFAIAIGFLLLIVPGLYLLTIWAVTSPAIVAERRGAIEAFGRSNELVKGEGWNVFFTILIAFLITILFTSLAVLIGASVGTGGAIIGGIIASTLTAPVAALVASVLFFDLGGQGDGAQAAPAAVASPPATPTV